MMRDSYPEPAPGAIEENDGDVNLFEYVDLVRRHWRFIAIAGLLGIGAGLVHYFNTSEYYTARTRILIERRSASPVGGQAYWMEPWWNPEFYPTQHEILKSRGLALGVVEQLRLWEDPKFNPGGAAKKSTDGEVTAAADEAFKGQLADQVRGGLEVREVKGTQLVDISFRATDPELAMRVANGYATAFIEYGKSERRKSASTASGFLSDEIEGLKREISEKEFKLQQFSRETDLVTVDKDSNVILQRLDAINKDYIAARTRRIEAEARYNEILMSPRELIAEPLSGGVVNDLRSKLSDKEREYATKLKTYKADFPTMMQLESEIEELRTELGKVVGQMGQHAIESARAEFHTTRRSQQGLERELDDLKNQSLEMNSAAIEYSNLRSEIDNRKTLLDELLRRQSETEVAKRGSEQSTIQQIDRALLPGRPSSPNLKRSTGMGTAVGIVLGIGLIMLLEFLDRSFKTPEELERRLRVPVLAIIPDISSERGYSYTRFYGSYYGRNPYSYSKRRRLDGQEASVDLIPHRRPRLAVSEAYRSLRTALLLSSAQELKVIAVTSATAGEGKTATAANLATVMAQLGKRTLLIDADMRKPRCHEVFKVTNRKGLVNFLVGRSEINEVLQETKVPSLVLLPSGPAPPNPSELLSSDRMRYVLREVGKLYDFVIVDTPPTLAVTDSTLIGSMADGVVLCIRAGLIPREVAKDCRDRLALAGVRLLGAVLNCHLQGGGGYYRSYYAHYEAYGESSRTGKDEAEGAVA